MSKRHLLVIILATFFATGCTSEKQSSPPVTTSVTPTISKAALSLMEEADALDGTKDHVIGKCYVCSLGMNGSDKFAVKAGGYTAHLCSKSCQQEFEKSTEEIVLHTKLPKGE